MAFVFITLLFSLCYFFVYQVEFVSVLFRRWEFCICFLLFSGTTKKNIQVSDPDISTNKKKNTLRFDVNNKKNENIQYLYE